MTIGLLYVVPNTRKMFGRMENNQPFIGHIDRYIYKQLFKDNICTLCSLISLFLWIVNTKWIAILNRSIWFYLILFSYFEEADLYKTHGLLSTLWISAVSQREWGKYKSLRFNLNVHCIVLLSAIKIIIMCHFLIKGT